MSGSRRIVVGNLAQGKLRGKALSDALYNELCSEQKEDGVIKKKYDSKSK